eukprot:247346_1
MVTKEWFALPLYILFILNLSYFKCEEICRHAVTDTVHCQDYYPKSDQMVPLALDVTTRSNMRGSSHKYEPFDSDCMENKVIEEISGFDELQLGLSFNVTSITCDGNVAVSIDDRNQSDVTAYAAACVYFVIEYSREWIEYLKCPHDKELDNFESTQFPFLNDYCYETVDALDDLEMNAKLVCDDGTVTQYIYEKNDTQCEGETIGTNVIWVDGQCIETTGSIGDEVKWFTNVYCDADKSHRVSVVVSIVLLVNTLFWM